MTDFMTILKRAVESGSPCLNPVVTPKLSVDTSLTLEGK